MNPIITPTYLAALIDGEGHIRLRSTPCVEITNSHKPTLDAIQKQYGGRVYCTNPYNKCADHRKIWRWVANAEDAVSVLLKTKEFMQIKNLIAMSCLKANDTKDAEVRMLLVNYMKLEQNKEYKK